MRPWKSRAGQIIIPAMLLFPTLFLFIYLIYETAKLSRDKIKHQFAMDAAAFVEATNYSDFLNRTAYVNGAFPMRIFQEGYDTFKAECEGVPRDKSADCDRNYTYAEMLYKNGIFPRSESGGSGKKSFTGADDVWDIKYIESGAGAVRNAITYSSGEIPNPVVIFTIDDAQKFWHPWDLAAEIYQLYVQIFSLLGSVEDAQWKVLERLTNGPPAHSFLQKSYWLNTGDGPNYGAALSDSFDAALDGFKTKGHCADTVVIHGNKLIGGPGLQRYEVRGWDPPERFPTSAGCGDGGRLFQMQTVDEDSLNAFKNQAGGSAYPGLPLTLRWELPGRNYFDVDFGNMPDKFPGGAPTLHTTVSVGTNPSAKVWPNPTPKFQVRQFP